MRAQPHSASAGPRIVQAQPTATTLEDLVTARNQRRERLGELGLACEKQGRYNEHVRTAWLRSYGEPYLQLQQASVRMQQAELRLAQIALAPRQSREQVDAAIEAQLDALAVKRQQAEHRQKIIPLLIPLPGDGGVIDVESLVGLMARAREALAFLHRLHPDVLGQPQFAQLTPAQREALDDLYREFKMLRASDLRYEPGQLGFEMPDVGQLILARLRGRAILASAGIDCDPDSVVFGDTLQARIDWVQQQIEQLDRELARLTAELHALEEEREVSAMRLELASPELEPKIRRKLREAADRLDAQALEKEQQIEAYFATDLPEGAT